MSYMCLLFGQHGFPLKNDVKAFDELSDMGHVAVKWKQMISVPIFLNLLINVIINNKIIEVKNIFKVLIGQVWSEFWGNIISFI